METNKEPAVTPVIPAPATAPVEKDSLEKRVSILEQLVTKLLADRKPTMDSAEREAMKGARVNRFAEREAKAAAAAEAAKVKGK
jgi:hypothetical protein